MTKRLKRTLLLLTVAGVSVVSLEAQQVTFDRLLRSDGESQNWLTYSGSFRSQRYSPLTQITPENVKNLEPQWVFQSRSLEKFEATAARRGRRLVHRAATERPRGARRHDRANVLDVFVSAARGCTSLLRPREPRRRDPWRHACSWAPSTATSSRSTPRAGVLVWDVKLEQAGSRLCLDGRAARCQRQGHRRHRRRRIRHPRLPRRVRCQDRKGSLALLHDCRVPASRGARPGAAIPGRRAAVRSGSPVRTIPSRT